MVRVLQLGCFGDDNLGDEVLAAEIRRQLRLRFPNADIAFTMATRDIAHSERAHPDVAAFIDEKTLPRVAGNGRSYGLVVLGGGTLLGVHIIRSARLFLDSPLAAGANVFAWGCGVDPIVTGARPRDLLRFAACARRITVRNETCRRYLDNAGVAGAVVTADPAYSIPVPAHHPANVAVINLSEHLRRSPRREVSALLEGVAVGLSRYQRDTSCELRFLPMRARAPRRWRSDLDWASLLARRLGPEPALGIMRENTADAALDTLSHADVFIGMRFHACLLAATTGCRVIGISASEKMRQLFEELGVAEQLLSPAEAANHARVIGLLASAHAAEVGRIRELRSRAERTADLVELEQAEG